LHDHGAGFLEVFRQTAGELEICEDFVLVHLSHDGAEVSSSG
jgi:hypothetical protein